MHAVSSGRRVHMISPRGTQMLEAFERSKSSDASAGTLDPQHAKQEWQQRCTPHDNSIAQLLVPTQEEDYKATMLFMVEVCLNSTVFTTQFEASKQTLVLNNSGNKTGRRKNIFSFRNCMQHSDFE